MQQGRSGLLAGNPCRPLQHLASLLRIHAAHDFLVYAKRDQSPTVNCLSPLPFGLAFLRSCARCFVKCSARTHNIYLIVANSLVRINVSAGVCPRRITQASAKKA